MSLVIPKVSAPLAKSIRTGEGIFVYATGIAVSLFSALESDKLPPREAAIVVGAMAILHGLTRTYLKIVALQKNVGIGNPIPVNPSNAGPVLS